MGYANLYGVDALAKKAASSAASTAFASAYKSELPSPYATGGPTRADQYVPIGPTSGVADSGTPSQPTVAPPPTVTPPAGSLSIPLDYQALIESDPNYIAWQANSTKDLSDAASSRAAAIKALVMQYGGLPEGFTDTYGDLSSGDLQAAAANPYSQTADLNRNYQQNVQQMQRALAARGALHSGDLGYNQGQLDTQLGQSQYDLGTSFATDLQNAINGYLGAESTDRQNQASAISQAYSDVSNNPAYSGGDETATLDPNWQTTYGKPVYVTPDGTKYVVGPDGTPTVYGG